jgi:hypothetical protein
MCSVAKVGRDILPGVVIVVVVVAVECVGCVGCVGSVVTRKRFGRV